MPIVYAAIAHHNEVIAEHPEKEYPKLAEVCQRIVAQIPLNEKRKKTFDEDTYKFHYSSLGQRVYICVAHKEVPLRICYAFLDSLEPLLNKDFNSPKKILKERMDFANDPANDKIGNLQTEIDEVKDVMMENIDRVLQRGERLDNLANKTNQLMENAQDFHRSARTLKRNLCLKHAKLTALIVCLVLIIILIIVLVACNPNFSKCRK
eukprot:NODE_7188_length_801_cov_159.171091_g6581_i0.p1 GENE.NODE_7188_length_801_cov_159.171091_g6581_i0~~NODE_7188_length_801_cov_159.171091_g6581_i0.p1  ORF type:complete len:207 (-),score=9.59 NODE_7188_length_801_cov_159.171091_g6581_i0:114-734(-)